MADRTKIEWTDATWNPIRGCTRVSEGCRHCYAEVMAARFSDSGQWGHGLAQRVTLPGGGTDHRWTGKVELVDTALDLPLRWYTPRRIFVNSTSDLFHEKVPDEWIDRVFAVMALAPQHRFQVLTKRPERMRAYLTRIDTPARWAGMALAVSARYVPPSPFVFTVGQPLPNVWLGTSIEDQATAEERIPHLMGTPAAVRFISAEPLLGPVDLRRLTVQVGGHQEWTDALTGETVFSQSGCVIAERDPIDWVICGGESGPGARPMHPDWARSLRDQCQAAGVPFFMKQMSGPRKATMPPIPDDLMVREFPNV
jgi:protein gp37